MESKAKFLIRLDDACPQMDLTKWLKFERLFDKYGIKPIVGVVPNNKDETLKFNKSYAGFWEKVREWKEIGWEIALHGYNHVYTTKEAGILGINEFSEFAGVNIDIQIEKIKKGVQIFRKHELSPRVWVAPAHSFDRNTLKALKENSEIYVISDGIAFDVYFEEAFYWLPQQLWKIKYKKKGIWTFCYHPNTVTERNFILLENFLAKYSQQFISFEELKDDYLKRRKKSKYEILYTKLFFIKLKIFKNIYNLKLMFSNI